MYKMKGHMEEEGKRKEPYVADDATLLRRNKERVDVLTRLLQGINGVEIKSSIRRTINFALGFKF